MSTRYLDPRNDLAFKKIFGSEKHKRIPIDFLNAVFHLEGQEKIISLEFLATTQVPEIAARKQSIVDVLVQDQAGSKYVIEMQVAKVEGFEKRAQYYAAKTYCAHVDRGTDYSDLKKVIFLAITDYIVFPKKEGYKSDHVVLDNKTYEHDLKDFSFTFVELPKFTKTLDQLETVEDKWYYFLKHADESKDIEKVLSHHPEIKEAYEILDRYQWSEGELEYYDKLLLDVMDANNIIKAAKKDGREEGRQEGRQEGLKEGHQKGFEEGVQQGVQAASQKIRINIAQSMLESGMALEQVIKLAELSEEDTQVLLSLNTIQ